MRVYRIAAAGVLLLAFLLLLPGLVKAAGLSSREWNIDGNARRALVHFPAQSNGGHVYPNDAPETIVDFFKQHARK